MDSKDEKSKDVQKMEKVKYSDMYFTKYLQH